MNSCKNCSKEIEQEAIFCKFCGTKIIEVRDNDFQGDRNMKKNCNHCGNELLEEYGFCKRCGKPVSLDEMPINTPSTDEIKENNETKQNLIKKSNKSNPKTLIIIVTCIIALASIIGIYTAINAPLNEAKGYVDNMAEYYQNMQDSYDSMVSTSNSEYQETYANLFDDWNGLYKNAETRLNNAENELSDWQKGKLHEYKIKAFTEAGLL